MRRIALTLIAMITTPAFAATLPITGSYGDAYGCKVAAGKQADQPNDWILVTPKGARGHEWDCSFISARDHKVVAACSEAGDVDGNIKPSSESIGLTEDRSAGTLTYTNINGTFVLHRCPS